MIPREEIEILVLGPDDAHVLEHVDEDVFDHPVRPELVAAFLAESCNLLVVAIYEGTVIGMASGVFYLHPDKPLQLFVNEVGVAGPFQRQGIGARLVQQALERARSLGCTGAWVATEEENSPARALYKALGGEEDPSRAVVYTWQLDA